MKIGIVIPWREQESRIQPFNEVVSWYKHNFPDANMYFPDHPGEHWLPSHTRNDGMRMAEADGCEVVIFNDADTIPQYGSLIRAIRQSVTDGLMHNPYKNYYALTEYGTEKYLMGVDPSKCEAKLFKNSCFGTVVCTPETWWSIGGMDEKFKQWGWEDTAMEQAHLVIKGTRFVKHYGSVYAIWHQPQPKKGSQTFSDNKRLYEERYLKVKTAKEMLDLVASKV